MTNLPDAAADPAHYLRGFMFIDELVDDVVDGLRKAGWNELESTYLSKSRADG